MEVRTKPIYEIQSFDEVLNLCQQFFESGSDISYLDSEAQQFRPYIDVVKEKQLGIPEILYCLGRSIDELYANNPIGPETKRIATSLQFASSECDFFDSTHHILLAKTVLDEFVKEMGMKEEPKVLLKSGQRDPKLQWGKYTLEFHISEGKLVSSFGEVIETEDEYLPEAYNELPFQETENLQRLFDLKALGGLVDDWLDNSTSSANISELMGIKVRIFEEILVLFENYPDDDYLWGIKSMMNAKWV